MWRVWAEAVVSSEEMGTEAKTSSSLRVLFEACSPPRPCTGVSVYYAGFHRVTGARSARGHQSLQRVGAPGAWGQEKSGVTQTEEEPSPAQRLTFQQGKSCRDSVQARPDIAPGGRAGAPGCLGDTSAQWGRECLEKQGKTVTSSQESPHLLPARAQSSLS